MLGFGTVGRLLGTGREGVPARQAQLNHPAALAVDAAGNLYVADAGNDRIVMVGAPY